MRLKSCLLSLWLTLSGFGFLLTSCSKDSLEIDPNNINLKELMVGRWSVSEIKVLENGAWKTTEEDVVACISQSRLLYRSDFSYADENAHHWIYGGKDGGGCVSVDDSEHLESATWEVIDNEKVKVTITYKNGGYLIREFTPLFVHKKLYKILTEYDNTSSPSAKEVYFSRRN